MTPPIPKADRGYVVQRQGRWPGYALCCQFCGFSISPRLRLGRYNRARGKMVSHLYQMHRTALYAIAGQT
jgi:hypothetical protein